MIISPPEMISQELKNWSVDSFGVSPNEYEHYSSYSLEFARKYHIPLSLAWNLLISAIYSVEGSEHCTYQHTKLLIQKLITLPGNPKYPIFRGSEAGGVYITENLAVVFKIESHNHPSAVEPFQGAATGVGGIVRDIFAMGARPTGVMDGLFFGPINRGDEHVTKHNQRLFGGVVSGVGGYGNSLGLPNVGGQLFFSENYSGNPLVNVWSEGTLDLEKAVLASTAKPGGIVMVLGNDTGADGVGGASVLASHTFEEGQEDRRPTVQVGDPFREKKLMEAYLELVDKGLIMAAKDMGAAGLTCTTTETCEASGVGMDIDLDKVPLRESPLEAHVVMMSESQERMLVVVHPRNVSAVQKIVAEKWELHAAVIGKVTRQKTLKIRNQGKLISVGDPFDMVGRPPIELKPVKPDYIDELHKFDIDALVSEKGSTDFNQTLLKMLSSPNIASARAVWRQYDHQVGTDTILVPGRADAVVTRFKGLKIGGARTMDCNPRYCYLDPEEGAAIAVAEAFRNLACVGAVGVAASDGLNFGNPERGEVAWQLERSFDGMLKALRHFQVAIVSGNASLYNESSGTAIWPTPLIGMYGVLDDVTKHATAEFKKAGDIIYLVGPNYKGALGGSEYLHWIHGIVAGKPPHLDLEVEKKTSDFVRMSIEKGLLSSAHDCSMGGLLVNVAEQAMFGNIGATVTFDEVNPHVFFGENQSRVVVSVSPEYSQELEEMAQQSQVNLQILGHVEGEDLVVRKRQEEVPVVQLSVQEMKEVYERVFN